MNRNAKRRIVFYGGLFLAIAAPAVWMTSMPGSSYRGPLPPLDARESAYETELRAHIGKLAGDIGERNVPTYPKLKEAAELIAATLTGAGYQVRHHTYDVAGRACDNLEADVAGDAKKEEIVLIGAHYDSVRGVAGADDNASGTAAVLALARAFGTPRAKRPLRTIRFVAFVNEEPPYFWGSDMGSLVYAKEARARGDRIVAMLSLETIGYFADGEGTQSYPFPMSLLYPSTGDFVAFVGNTSSRSLTRDVVRSFRGHTSMPSEGAALPAAIPGVGWSDQWSFWQQDYAGVMVTDTAPFRNPNYHKTSDRPETLDYPRFARVVAGLEQVVEDLANR